MVVHVGLSVGSVHLSVCLSFTPSIHIVLKSIFVSLFLIPNMEHLIIDLENLSSAFHILRWSINVFCTDTIYSDATFLFRHGEERGGRIRHATSPR